MIYRFFAYFRDVFLVPDPVPAAWTHPAEEGRHYHPSLLASGLQGRKTAIFSLLKVTVSRDGYFFESLNILVSTSRADGFQWHLKAFRFPI
jgi:hypothetical protein